jgi:hypothetical protein
MKRFATIALTVLFVTSIAGAAMAERTGLSITGSLELMARQDENQEPMLVLGTQGVDNRIEEKVNLNLDADLTDNVSMRLGLEATGGYGGDGTLGNLDAQGSALAIDEAYMELKELFLEELTVKAGVMTKEYSLRDDGDSMFLSLPEIGAWFATLDYDPLYVDVLIGKQIERRRALGFTDQDIYAVALEYYLENESKIQAIAAIVQDEALDVGLSQYSAGVTYMVLDDLEVYAQIGGQGGEMAAANADVSAFA